MQTDVVGHNLASRTAWYHVVAREITLSWKFIAGDLSSAVVPALLWIGAAWSSGSLPGSALLWSIAKGTLYFWLYIYVFCLSNQLAGISEDRLNKPHRPIVAGLVSVKGTQRRWLVVALIYLGVGVMLGVWKWMALWQVITLLHNFGRWAKLWLTKNLSMGLGIIAQLGAAWELVRPITPIAWQWMIVIAAAIFVLVPVQDLRDMVGDQAAGRRTLPLVFGERTTRYGLALGFALLPLIVHRWLMLPLGLNLAVLLCNLGLTLVSLTISARLLFFRSPRSDHWTYLLFTYWYCLVLLSAIIVM